MNPVESLPTLITRLSTFHSINRGGCGVVAAHVAKRLQHIVPTRIVVFNEDKSIKIDKIRPNLKNSRSARQWRWEGMRWDHVMVEFDYKGQSYLFDSTGIFPAKKMIDFCGSKYHKSGYVTIDEICCIAAHPNNWNSWFNRDQIEPIRRKIGRFFKRYLPAPGVAA